MKKRLDYLDMAKGIGMVLVLLGHLQGDMIFQLSPYIHPLCVFIFSFHMPLFFIISGILMAIKNDEDKSLSQIAKKRFRGIMIPYLWFSGFYLSVVVYALIMKSIQIETLLVNLWYVISGYGMNVLWFLPAIYLAELIFIILRQKIAKSKGEITFIISIVIISVIALIAGYALTKMDTDITVNKRIREFITVLIRPLLACGFITIGYYVHKLWDKKITEASPITMIRRSIYIIGGIILLGVCAGFAHVNNGIDFRTMVFRNVFFFLLCALSGSFGLILFCKGLPRIGLFTYWGVGSLIFMGTHNSETILYYAMKLAMFANQYLTRARGYICYAIIVLVILVYTTAMIFIIQKFFPFVIGKPFKRQKSES